MFGKFFRRGPSSEPQKNETQNLITTPNAATEANESKGIFGTIKSVTNNLRRKISHAIPKTLKAATGGLALLGAFNSCDLKEEQINPQPIVTASTVDFKAEQEKAEPKVVEMPTLKVQSQNPGAQSLQNTKEKEFYYADVEVKPAFRYAPVEVVENQAQVANNSKDVYYRDVEVVEPYYYADVEVIPSTEENAEEPAVRYADVTVIDEKPEPKLATDKNAVAQTAPTPEITAETLALYGNYQGGKEITVERGQSLLRIARMEAGSAVKKDEILQITRAIAIKNSAEGVMTRENTRNLRRGQKIILPTVEEVIALSQDQNAVNQDWDNYYQAGQEQRAAAEQATPAVKTASAPEAKQIFDFTLTAENSDQEQTPETLTVDAPQSAPDSNQIQSQTSSNIQSLLAQLKAPQIQPKAAPTKDPLAAIKAKYSKPKTTPQAPKDLSQVLAAIREQRLKKSRYS